MLLLKKIFFLFFVKCNRVHWAHLTVLNVSNKHWKSTLWVAPDEKSCQRNWKKNGITIQTQLYVSTTNPNLFNWIQRFWLLLLFLLLLWFVTVSKQVLAIELDKQLPKVRDKHEVFIHSVNSISNRIHFLTPKHNLIFNIISK